MRTNRIANVFFIGAKYAVTSQIDVAAAYYYLEQNNYNSSTTPCAYANTTNSQPNGNPLEVSRINNSACAGSQDAISFLIDYRPVKRVDLYAGVMISNVFGGLANSYAVTQKSPRRPACASSSKSPVLTPNRRRALNASAASLLSTSRGERSIWRHSLALRG